MFIYDFSFHSVILGTCITIMVFMDFVKLNFKHIV